MFLIAREGGREVLWLSAGENLCATSSTFAGRRHMIGKVVTGCVAILPYHTATQDRGSECRDFGFISRIVTALIHTVSHTVLKGGSMYCAVCIQYYISTLFQIKSHSFAFPPKARKSLPIDRLEQLKAQLSSASQQQLIGQLEEVISKLEPLDSACSSRRSSISSHVSPKTHRHM